MAAPSPPRFHPTPGHVLFVLLWSQQPRSPLLAVPNPLSGALAVDAWHLCHHQPHGGVPRSLYGWIGGLRDEWADRWRKQGRQGWRGGWMDGWVVGPHPAHGSSTTGAHSSAGQRRVPKFHQQHSLLPSRSAIKTSTAARLPQACARTAAVPDCNHFGGSPADPVVNPPSRD